MLSSRWLGIWLALVLGAPTSATAGPGTALGSYEAAALSRGLARRKLVLADQPDGKPLGRIHVVNLDVFGDDEAWLEWANIFHVTTKEYVIEREVLLRPGQPWVAEVVEETRRRLTDGLFTSLVVLAPVVSATPGAVDLLVVTRDMWSLRLNTRFEVQAGVLSDLNIAVAENNLLGRRKQVAFAFDMDLGSFTLGPQYVDKNIAGTHMTLIGKWGAIFSRETGEFEGTRSITQLAYPLWSLDRKWGGYLTANHYDAKIRLFCGAELFAYQNLDAERCDDPLPDGEVAIPAAYALRTVSLESSVVRQFGRSIKQRVSLGHRLELVRPSLLDDFPGDAMTAERFAADLFPRSERSSAVFVRYALFTPQYRVLRDVESYDLAEDFRLGPELELELATGSELLGSTVDFVSGAIGVGLSLAIPGDGLFRVSASSGVRRSAGAYTDRVLSGTTTVASPQIIGLRLIGRLNVASRMYDTNNQFYLVGGSTGLRGYPINFFRGDRQLVGNLEIRSAPQRLLFTRIGAVAFWDAGHAAERFDQLRLYHDVGIGIRGLVPQLQPFVFRFDWAIPLTGAGAGLPGRFTAGVQQAF